MKINKLIVISVLVVAIISSFIFIPKVYDNYQKSKITKKIEQLKKEADYLTYKGEYIEATEIINEIIALKEGRKYVRDPNPNETFELKGKIKTKSLFDKLEFSDIKVLWSIKRRLPVPFRECS